MSPGLTDFAKMLQAVLIPVFDAVKIVAGALGIAFNDLNSLIRFLFMTVMQLVNAYMLMDDAMTAVSMTVKHWATEFATATSSLQILMAGLGSATKKMFSDPKGSVDDAKKAFADFGTAVSSAFSRPTAAIDYMKKSFDGFIDRGKFAWDDFVKHFAHNEANVRAIWQRMPWNDPAPEHKEEHKGGTAPEKATAPEDILAKWKKEFAERKIMADAFRGEDVLADAEFWQKKLALAKNNKDLMHGVALELKKAEDSVRKSSFDEWDTMMKDQEVKAKGNVGAELILAKERVAMVSSIYGESSKQATEAKDKEFQIQRKYDEDIQARMKSADAFTASMAKIQSDRDHDNAATAYDLHQTTWSQKQAITIAGNEAEYKINHDSLERQLKDEQLTVEKRQELAQSLVEMESKHEADMARFGNERVLHDNEINKALEASTASHDAVMISQQAEVTRKRMSLMRQVGDATLEDETALNMQLLVISRNAELARIDQEIKDAGVRDDLLADLRLKRQEAEGRFEVDLTNIAINAAQKSIEERKKIQDNALQQDAARFAIEQNTQATHDEAMLAQNRITIEEYRTNQLQRLQDTYAFEDRQLEARRDAAVKGSSDQVNLDAERVTRAEKYRADYLALIDRTATQEYQKMKALTALELEARVEEAKAEEKLAIQTASNLVAMGLKTETQRTADVIAAMRSRAAIEATSFAVKADQQPAGSPARAAIDQAAVNAERATREQIIAIISQAAIREKNISDQIARDRLKDLASLVSSTSKAEEAQITESEKAGRISIEEKYQKLRDLQQMSYQAHDAILKEELKTYKDDTLEYKKSVEAKEKADAEYELQKNETLNREKADTTARARAIAQIDRTTQSELDKLGLDEKKAILDQEVMLGQKTALQRIQELRKYYLQEAELRRKDLEETMASEDQKSAAHAQHLAQLRIMDAQRAKQLSDYSRQEVTESSKKYVSIFSDMSSAIHTSITGIIQGTQTLQQALGKIGQTIMLSLIENLALKPLEEFLKAEAMKLIAHKTTTEAMTADDLMNAWTGQMLADETAGSEILDNAAVAGSAATASAASIPGYGWMIAAGAGLAAYAAAKSFASHDTGAWNIPSDHIARVHRGEMIVPAMGGQADAARAILGGGGGGSTTIHFNVSATDAASVARLFNENGAALADAIQKQSRNFRIRP